MVDKFDYYKELGVDRTADAETIKKAYRKKALLHHPDRNGGSNTAEEKFKRCVDAYEVLSDANKKAAYDRRNGYTYSTNSQTNSRSTGSEQRKEQGQTNNKHDAYDRYRKQEEAEFNNGTAFDGRTYRTNETYQTYGQGNGQKSAPQDGDDYRHDSYSQNIDQEESSPRRTHYPILLLILAMGLGIHHLSKNGLPRAVEEFFTTEAVKRARNQNDDIETYIPDSLLFKQTPHASAKKESTHGEIVQEEQAGINACTQLLQHIARNYTITKNETHLQVGYDNNGNGYISIIRIGIYIDRDTKGKQQQIKMTYEGPGCGGTFIHKRNNPPTRSGYGDAQILKRATTGQVFAE